MPLTRRLLHVLADAGTPAPLVAEWAGHTVEVLLRIYAHCIDGDDELWFGPMDDALSRD